MQKFIIKVDEIDENLVENLSEDCYLLSSAQDVGFCKKFIERAKRDEKLVLFYGDEAIDKALFFEADGVLLDIGSDGVKEKIRLIRKKLKKDSVVGLVTRSKRHDCMLVAEGEPDFVVFKIYKDGFDNLKELTDWYSDFFLIPSAGLLMDDGIDYANLKTDFIIK